MNRSINIQCFGNGITILLTKKHLPSFNHSSFHLNNNSCTGHRLNHSHIILQTGLSDCGTIKRSFNGSYIYANLVHGYLNNPKNCSSKNITTTFAVECKQPSALAMKNKTTSEFGKNLPKVGSEEVYAKPESKLQTMPLLAHEGWGRKYKSFNKQVFEERKRSAEEIAKKQERFSDNLQGLESEKDKSRITL
ncbi:uncharacterized protein LOC110044824 [Orbicella faveolata]|uniref:uncharacterized protein LOC110044824 n=1 Tax=Orbicella faveolata TaxID=48498 RepID=UPI0009E25CA5|nr:uncharacterized protein LOC110044824 [Orbicella faveolata]